MTHSPPLHKATNSPGIVASLVGRARISMNFVLILTASSIWAGLQVPEHQKLLVQVNQVFEDITTLFNADYIKSNLEISPINALGSLTQKEEESDAYDRLDTAIQFLADGYQELAFMCQSIDAFVEKHKDLQQLALNDLRELASMTPPAQFDSFLSQITLYLNQAKEEEFLKSHSFDQAPVFIAHDDKLSRKRLTKYKSSWKIFLDKWRHTLDALPIGEIEDAYSSSGVGSSTPIYSVMDKIQPTVKIPIIGGELQVQSAIHIFFIAITALLFHIFTVAQSIKNVSGFAESEPGEGLDWIFFLPSRNNIGFFLGGLWLGLPLVTPIIACYKGHLGVAWAIAEFAVFFLLWGCVLTKIHVARTSLYRSVLPPKWGEIDPTAKCN